MNDEQFMKQAIVLAQCTQRSQAKKPIVGCIIVKDNNIISQGTTQPVGDHAEIAALQKANNQAKGATVYVTLEPCTHKHRNPPCAQALVDAGVKRVVYGELDANPQVKGGGISFLKNHKILVGQVLNKECKELHKYFLYAQEHKQPRIIQKAAMSSDYKITAKIGELTSISGKEARDHTHQLRSQIDAILIGSQTVIVDNPKLTARSGKDCTQPLRVILDRRLRTDVKHTVYKDDNVIIFTTKENNEQKREKIKLFKEKNIEIIELDKEHFLEQTLTALFQRKIYSVLVEGGAKIHESFLKLPIQKELLIYISPKEFGQQGVSAFSSLDVKQIIKKLNVLEDKKIGKDRLIKGIYHV